jgi:hypothetical protein
MNERIGRVHGLVWNMLLLARREQSAKEDLLDLVLGPASDSEPTGDGRGKVSWEAERIRALVHMAAALEPRRAHARAARGAIAPAELVRELEDLVRAGSRDVEQLGLRLLRYLARLERAADAERRLVALQHVSQMIAVASREAVDALAREMLADEDHRLRGEMCYALGLSRRTEYLDLVEARAGDELEHPWVREQARHAAETILGRAPDEGAVLGDTLTRLLVTPFAAVLTHLLDCAHETLDDFEDEHQRYDLLARLRRVFRDEFFVQLPEFSLDARLAAAVISAANRTVAKALLRAHVDTFIDALTTLKDGSLDGERLGDLEDRLREIDNDGELPPVSRHDDSV